eukprot:TRINITY_DN2170_c0_g7_i3.p1 TRINITY_DN2170_c0_g7~~TRINITY_DN2170_c0_g7_i3.p1  ORF type:complete len:621 (-),score=123.80 TRINITY_DN2170_c0_g7_i3:112-1974(-)
MKSLIFLSILILTLAHSDTISLLESLYDSRKYSTLRTMLKQERKKADEKLLAVVNRLEGHLCWFGMQSDYHVDLSCAWNRYATAAQLGDSEGLFYAGLMLNNFLFDSLEPLKGKFGKEVGLVEEAGDLTAKIKAIKALAFTMNFMSSTLGFPLAMKYMGVTINKQADKCFVTASYYTWAADKLLPFFNASFQPVYKAGKEIRVTIDPFDIEDEKNNVYFLRYVEILAASSNLLANPEDVKNYLVSAYVDNGEYRLAKQLAESLIAKQSNNTYANYVLGLLYLAGKTVQMNYTLALNHLQVAANSSNGDALNLLGYMYLNGLGVRQNTTAAHECFEKSVARGNRYAAYNQGSQSFNPKDFMGNRAAQLFLASVLGGIMQGFYNLGMMYAYGIGVSQSCYTGIKYLGKALDLMIQRKYFNDTYRLFLSGKRKTAAMQYIVMADIGNVSAQVSAGNLFDGYNLIKEKLWIHQYEPTLNINKHLALKYYLAAFDNGEDAVCMRLGDFYYYGYEVERDLEKAVGFYNRSKNTVLSPAFYAGVLFNYGLLYQYGMGLPQDYQLASVFYNYSIVTDPSWYFPAKVMNTILTYEAHGIRETLPSLNFYFLLPPLAFLVVALLLIIKRI